MTAPEILKQRFQSNHADLSFLVASLGNEVTLFNYLSGDTLLLDSVSFSLLVCICEPVFDVVFNDESFVGLENYDLDHLADCLAGLTNLGFIRSVKA